MQRNCKVIPFACRVALVAITIVMLFSFVGCDEKAPMQTGNLEDTAVFEDLSIKGEITLTCATGSSGSEVEMMAPTAIAAAFMKEYEGTKVYVEDIDRGQFPALIASGDIGDVFWCDEADAVNYQLNHNALMPVDAYLKPLGIDTTTIYAGALKCGYIDGRLYMVPRKLGQQVLIFNRSATTAAGLDIPLDSAMDWEYFKSICKQLTISTDGDDSIDQVGAAFRVWWTVNWIAFAEGWGGKWCDPENKTITFASDPLVVKGFEEMFEGLIEGWMYPEAMGYTGGHSGIAETSYVFRNMGAFSWLQSYGTAYDAARIDWDFCPFPAFPVHKVAAGSTGYVVYNRTANPDTAAAFALYFLTEDGQRAYHSQTGGSTPLHIDLSYEDFWRGQGTNWEDKNYDAFISYPDATTIGTVVVQTPPEIADLLSNSNMVNLFTQILNNRITLIDALTSLERQANEIWQSLL